MGDKQSPEANSDRACGSRQAKKPGQGAQEEAKKIQVGMVVEADQGDLGQQDISVDLRRLEEEGLPDDRVTISQVLGPGPLSGMAGDDASSVASYSLDGAQNGYGHLWLMFLSTPLLQAVQFACAKIGRLQQKGLAEILRDRCGKKVAVPAAAPDVPGKCVARVLSSALNVLLVVIGNSRGIMGKNKLGLVTNAGLVAAALVMFGASLLLFYGLATGHGG